MTSTMTMGPDHARAVISDDKVYRYHLGRRWAAPFGREGPARILGVLMLNPSTADAFKNDRTISKVIHYAQEWGYNAISVANVFAMRTTYPHELKPYTDEQRTGEENESYIMQMFLESYDKILCGWGANPLAAPRIPAICNLLQSMNKHLPERRHKEMVYVKLTGKGMPMHPLYQRNDLKPKPWSLPT
jgi:hypothetical protein